MTYLQAAEAHRNAKHLFAAYLSYGARYEAGYWEYKRLGAAWCGKGCVAWFTHSRREIKS